MPGLLGLLGATGAGLALAPALRVLIWPLFGLTLLILARGWYVEFGRKGGWRSAWARRSTVVLIGSTALAASLWGLRFAGVLGMSPL